MSDRTTSVFDRVSDRDVSARFAVSAVLPPGSSDGRSPSLRKRNGESASFSSKVGLAISPSAWRQAARHAQWLRTEKRKTLAASQINESQDSAWALRGNRHCAPSPPRSDAVRLCSHVSPLSNGTRAARALVITCGTGRYIPPGALTTLAAGNGVPAKDCVPAQRRLEGRANSTSGTSSQRQV